MECASLGVESAAVPHAPDQQFTICIVFSLLHCLHTLTPGHVDTELTQTYMVVTYQIMPLTLLCCRSIALLPLFNISSGYLSHKISSTVLASVATAVPMVVPDNFLAVYSIFKQEHVLVMVGCDGRHMTDYVRQFYVNVGWCLMLLLHSM